MHIIQLLGCYLVIRFFFEALALESLEAILPVEDLRTALKIWKLFCRQKVK